MHTEKNYEIRLKMVGEVVLVDGHDNDDEMKVGAITFDLGKLASVDYNSSQLRAQKWLPPKVLADLGKFTMYGLTRMLYLALDLDQGKFKGDRLAEAVSNGTLSGCKLRGDVDAEMVGKLDTMGLRAIAPLIDKKKVN
ncbi:hypothetical protein [Afipia carboxidovorans]|uniref:hypothetical protein n=1 Tax=Afipia carboxidovorans TaxID=40137 RepID=UPI003084BBBE|nr:hypothetical protein CRBSH125_21400 [Afipia carboxidovorans]